MKKKVASDDEKRAKKLYNRITYGHPLCKMVLLNSRNNFFFLSVVCPLNFSQSLTVVSAFRNNHHVIHCFY